MDDLISEDGTTENNGTCKRRKPFQDIKEGESEEDRTRMKKVDYEKGKKKKAENNESRGAPGGSKSPATRGPIVIKCNLVTGNS